MKYQENLTMRLAEGLGAIPDVARERHVKFLLDAQQADGGFAGREGLSDLYYTSFALRSLAILGELEGQTAETSAHFVERRLSGQESIVDFFSLIYSGALLDTAAGIDVFSKASPSWKSNVADTLEKLRREDGGYAKGAEGAISSTYHTFLVLICLQLLDCEIPNPDRVIQFLKSQAGEDGGFREIRASKRAGTNPTAAAIATLRILGGLTPEIRESTLDLLVEMQTDEGGLRANTRIPIADLLSTFTGSLTLLDLDGLDEIDTAAVVQYIAAMEREEGGFHAAAWDTYCDVEYTFYGLGCRALFAAIS